MPPITIPLETWRPMDPSKGPPLPSFFDIFWPWYTPPGADFKVSDLVISPSEVKPGQAVTISCTVTNIGVEAGDYTTKMGGDFVDEQTVTLAPGESKMVSFQVTPMVAKSYSVSINGLYGTFRATEAPVAEFAYVSGVRYSYATIEGTVAGEPGRIVTRGDYHLWEIDVKNVGNTPRELTLQCLISTHGEYWGEDYPWSDWVDISRFEELSIANYYLFDAGPYQELSKTIEPGQTVTFRGYCWGHWAPQIGWYVYAIRAMFIGDPGETEIKRGRVIQYG